MKKYLERSAPSILGLLQAVGVIIYCAIIASFFFFMAKSQANPGFFGFFLMLLLLVFSAAITGSLVFGYPVYLAVVKNKIKEALEILAFTLLYALTIILITVILITILA